MTKKYYRTTIIFEVLSEGSLEVTDFEEILDRCHDGDLSGDVKAQFDEQVSEDLMAHLLEAQRSSPEFLLGDAWHMKEELKKLEFALETTGGRSVELAERIDALLADIGEEERDG